MVLPRLGGSPFVWTTCLVFFQAMLLIGYAYAHALTRMAQRGRQVFIHLGIMLLAALTLPLGLGADAPPAGELPSWWLLMCLTLTAGPAVFVISATAPLLQSWFSALDVGAVGDPYFLYAGSNAGSLLALLTYPLLFEPAFELDKQALLWSAGFSALIISVALCAVPTSLRAKPALPSAPQADPTQSRLLERLRWTALAMAPSSLLLGVTTHITTDIVSGAAALGRSPGGLFALIHRRLRASVAGAARSGGAGHANSPDSSDHDNGARNANGFALCFCLSARYS